MSPARTARLCLANRDGLHARPCARLVRTARRHTSRLELRRGDRRADGRSVLELMLLEAGPGDEVEVRAEGDDADALLEAVRALFAGRFDEDADPAP